jgi:hypothetical protein
MQFIFEIVHNDYTDIYIMNQTRKNVIVIKLFKHLINLHKDIFGTAYVYTSYDIDKDIKRMKMKVNVYKRDIPYSLYKDVIDTFNDYDYDYHLFTENEISVESDFYGENIYIPQNNTEAIFERLADNIVSFL